MSVREIVKILKENYTLCELEEYMENVSIESFEDGLVEFVKENFEELSELLRKDCFFE